MPVWTLKRSVGYVEIARKALPDLESRSLEALCGYYQIPREHAHRAMDDVLETLALFRKLEEGFSEDHPEWFAAAPLKAKMKREVPATEAQKKVSGGSDPVP